LHLSAFGSSLSTRPANKAPSGSVPTTMSGGGQNVTSWQRGRNVPTMMLGGGQNGMSWQLGKNIP